MKNKQQTTATTNAKNRKEKKKLKSFPYRNTWKKQ